ncbi:MAG: pyridoxal phosphate-dependent aminotransferase, partial [Myxococcota bacterium]|nr:pyridoxal phosphate-dependent aminotransferase [Myxococcota bacterium]
RARCARNLAALRARTRDTAIDVPEVAGGWYASLRVPATQADETWALALLEGDGVLVHPGYLFEFPVRQAWLVVSLLTPEPIFDAGIDAIVARIARA